jgi:hypothetical protein
MRALLLTVGLIGLAACTPPPSTPPQAPAPEPQAAAPAPTASEADAKFAGMAGRWATTQEACAATNTARKGLLEMTAAAITLETDTCAVTKVSAQMGGGIGVDVEAKCTPAKGDAYERPFTFVSGSPDTLTWVSEGGEGTPYLRCK